VPRHCRAFAAALIERETDFYAQHGPARLAAFYRELGSKLERLADNEFLLQMSWGTGWTSKTVGSALDQSLIEEARRRYRLGRKGLTFPKTRRLVERGNTPQEPFGWVLVRLPGFAPAEFAEELPEPKAAEAPGRRTGRVKWFNKQKGYGFIAPDAGGPDMFVHISQLTGGLTTLHEGQSVSYVIGKGPKGRDQAQDVRPV
jgi:CspA family cold shock protein